MKIRCKNCYRVLNENEDYCTNCGEYSKEMAEYMKTGTRVVTQGEKLKTALLLFALIAFLGSGVISIGLAVIEGSVGENLTYNIINKLVTATSLFIALVITFRKDFKSIFFKGNKKQIIGSIVIGLLFNITVILISYFTKLTKIIPNNFTQFLSYNNDFISAIELLFVMTLIACCEEYIYRHRLIDFFDEETMLNDGWIITFTSIISTALSFAWFMSIEIIIMTAVINVFMTFLYMYTNRSLGVNIILKIVLYLLVIVLNFIL